MAKRAKPEEIIAKLREVEVRLSQGESAGKAAKLIDNFNQRARVITRKPRFDRNDEFVRQPLPDHQDQHRCRVRASRQSAPGRTRARCRLKRSHTPTDATDMAVMALRRGRRSGANA